MRGRRTSDRTQIASRHRRPSTQYFAESMGLRARRPFRPGLVLALLTLVGAVVRLGGLTAQSFWLDEFLWTQNSTGSVGGIFRLADGYPPLFGMIVHGLMEAGL